MLIEINMTIDLWELSMVVLINREEFFRCKNLVKKFPTSTVHPRIAPILIYSWGKIEEANVISLIWSIESLRADLASWGAV